MSSLLHSLAGESAGKAMSRIYGNIGFSGLWNGLPVRIVMIGTLTAFQWLMYVSIFPPSSPPREIPVADNHIPGTSEENKPVGLTQSFSSLATIPSRSGWAYPPPAATRACPT